MSPQSSAQVQVVSFRPVYRLDRRMYTLPTGRGHWRIPVAGGVPMWGAMYAGVTFALMLLLFTVPGASTVLSVTPKPLAVTVAPAAMGMVGSRWRPCQRMPHRHVVSLITEWAAGREFVGERRARHDRTHGIVTISPGVDWPTLIDAEIRGPAIVHTYEPVLVGRGMLGVRQVRASIDGRGTRLVRVAAGERLRIVGSGG